MIPFAILLLLIVPSAQAVEWAGSVETIDGVRHVTNPAEPAQDTLSIELEELWRIGGWSEEEGEFFGYIAGLVAGDDGKVYLLDLQLYEVKVFSPAGRYLHTLGRAGEGPGEFHSPSSLFLLPDGRLGVLQSNPSHATLFDPAGKYAGDLAVPEAIERGFHAVSSPRCRGGTLAMLSLDTHIEEGAMEQFSRLIRADLDGAETAEFARAAASTSRACASASGRPIPCSGPSAPPAAST